MTRPRRCAAVKTAERAPIQMWLSPRSMRSQLFSFALRELAVHDDDVVSETADKLSHDLAGQGDFRNDTSTPLLPCRNTSSA